MTVAEVAGLLGVGKSFVYRRTSQGHADPIPCFRFGGHLRFLRHEVEAWANQHRKAADAPPTAVPLAVTGPRQTLQLRVRSRRH